LLAGFSAGFFLDIKKSAKHIDGVKWIAWILCIITFGANGRNFNAQKSSKTYAKN
jgi:hypothetical protein